MKVHCLGATETVTGSKFLIDLSNEFGLIDCGLFQGLKTARKLNWQELPIDSKTISWVILTHAHLDHCGYLPRLVKQGFSGTIYMTEGTFDLVKIILRDSAVIQIEEAKLANESKRSKHSPALPLYDLEDVDKTLSLIKTVKRNELINIGQLSFKFQNAGHIIGASSVYLHIKEKVVCFSGDVGRFNDDLMNAPDFLESCDYLFMENTYGGKAHSSESATSYFKKLLEKVKKNQSVLMIPAFAVGRAQVVLKVIYDVIKANPNLKVPIYINSPMTVNASEIYQKHSEDHRLEKDQIENVYEIATWVEYSKQRQKIMHRDGPMIIIAASGMMTGGRILEHVAHFGKEEKNIILLVGYQAEGTRGRDLLEGNRDIKIRGSRVNLRAEVLTYSGFSAHFDSNEMLKWVNPINERLKEDKVKVFLIHGENESLEASKDMFLKHFGIDAKIPSVGEVIELD